MPVRVPASRHNKTSEAPAWDVYPARWPSSRADRQGSAAPTRWPCTREGARVLVTDVNEADGQQARRRIQRAAAGQRVVPAPGRARRSALAGSHCRRRSSGSAGCTCWSTTPASCGWRRRKLHARRLPLSERSHERGRLPRLQARDPGDQGERRRLDHQHVLASPRTSGIRSISLTAPPRAPCAR